MGGSKRRHAALFHELAERITAAGCYVSAAWSRTAVAPSETPPSAAEFLEQALVQLDEANEVFRKLRQALKQGFVPK